MLLKRDGKQEWTTGSAGKVAQDTVLLVQDDGHVRISSNGACVWRNTFQKLSGVEPDRLNADEFIQLGDRLTSPNGKYVLAVQADGQLIIAENNLITWTAEPLMDDWANKLIMRGDDELCMVGDRDKLCWTSMTRRRKNNGNATLILGDNGGATIKTDGLTLWSSNPKTVAVNLFEAQQVSICFALGACLAKGM